MKSRFHNITTDGDSGVLQSDNSIITIVASGFHNNHATNGDGGVILSFSSTITVEVSEFCNNSATLYGGGVVNSVNSTIMIVTSAFHYNTATERGGVLHSTNSAITICDSNFTENSSPIGAAIIALAGTKIQYHGYLLFDKNSANKYAVMYLSNSNLRGHTLLFSNNFGSLVAFNSNITFSGNATLKFVNNRPSTSKTTPIGFQEGGAITLFQSNVFIDGECYLECNHAENGGAIHSTDSKLYVNGIITIAHNTATGNGGGIYLSNSELNCQQKGRSVLFNNTAALKGGGLHAISSTIKAISNLLEYENYNTQYKTVFYIGTRINFTKNAAKIGGALSLEANAKLYILKYYERTITYDNFFAIENPVIYENDANTTIFIANNADYGAAVYVDDDTNSGTCAIDPKIECFFQVLTVDDNYYHAYDIVNLATQSMYFSQNYASISGSKLYGGLLDRCAVSVFAEIYKKYASESIIGGNAYFKNVSLVTDVSISSRPVRVRLCTNDARNYNYNQSHIKYVKKGEPFPVSLVAINQVGKSISAIIRTSLKFADSGLAEGQLERNVSAGCTNLIFNIVSPQNFENLILYASDGPC